MDLEDFVNVMKQYSKLSTPEKYLLDRIVDNPDLAENSDHQQLEHILSVLHNLPARADDEPIEGLREASEKLEIIVYGEVTSDFDEYDY